MNEGGIRKRHERSQKVRMEIHEFSLIYFPPFNLLLVNEEEVSHPAQ